MSYKLGSLFDGSGGFPLSGALCGIEPVWASEVEPYPIAVTRTRFPHLKHLGDISKINGAEIEPVDIITFGSPCQDLSVAGKRAGLKHEDNGDDETTRSGLFIEAVRIIKEMREKTNGEYPRFAVWENVPGAFSSNNGEDFRIVLEELIKIAEPTAVMPPVPKNGWAYADSYRGDGWSLAYRVFDAQYWGVPQRRRRIYLVADFRGGCAREILFERQGLRGYFETGGEAWQAVAPDAERSLGADDREGEELNALSMNWQAAAGAGLCVENELVNPLACTRTPAVCVPYTLKIRSGVSVDSSGKAAGKGALIQENMSATLGTSQDQYLFQPVGVDVYNTTVTGDVTCPLTAEGHTSTGTCPKVMVPIATLEPGIAAREGGHIYEDVSGTLRANAGDNQMSVAYAIDKAITTGGNCTAGGSCVHEELTPTLTTDRPHAVAYGISSYDSNAMKSSNPHSGIYEADTSRTLDLNGGNPACNQGGIVIVDSVGGQSESASEGGIAPCLRASHYKMAPCVALGVDAYNQTLTGDKAKTLNSAASDADHVPCTVYSVENHPADSRVNIDESGTVQTLTSRMGTGGGNVPMVMEPFCKSARGKFKGDAETWKHAEVANTLNTFDQGETRANELVVETIALEGNGQRPSHRGDGYAETDKSYTLNATEVHGVAYGFDPGASRDVGVLFIEECAKTLTNGTCPGHHDGVVIATPPAPITASKASFFMNADEDVASTLVATDYKDPQLVCYEDNPIAIDRAYFNQGQNALYDPQTYEDGTTPTLVARGPSAVAYGSGLDSNEVSHTLIARMETATGTTQDNLIISDYRNAPRYIVRRLTPTECARLQGFADRWGDVEPKTEFTDEEYLFWLEVRKTSDRINGRAEKDYTPEQMLTWYNKLHTDSAEYKMWGNGIALPTALYVIQGIGDVFMAEQSARSKWLDELLGE